MTAILASNFMSAISVPFSGAYITNSATDNGTSSPSWSISFGTPDPTRHLVVCIGGERVGATTVNSVTIGGVAADLVVARQGSGNAYVAIWIAHVPTGASGTVSASLSASALTCSIGIWEIFNPSSPTAVSTGNGTTTAAVTVVPGDFIIGASQNNSGSGTSWTNASERFDLNQSGAALSGADHLSVSSETRTLTSSAAARTIAAAWRG